MEKKITFRKISEVTGVNIVTLFKARERGKTSLRLAVTLCKSFGIPVREWLDPDQNKEAWDKLLSMKVKVSEKVIKPN